MIEKSYMTNTFCMEDNKTIFKIGGRITPDDRKYFLIHIFNKENETEVESMFFTEDINILFDAIKTIDKHLDLMLEEQKILKKQKGH